MWLIFMPQRTASAPTKDGHLEQETNYFRVETIADQNNQYTHKMTLNIPYLSSEL